MYYENGDGKMKKSNGDYDWYVNNGINVNGEVVYPGDTSNSVTYENGADAPFEPVASGGESAYSTYNHTSSDSNWASNNTNITSSNDNSDFEKAIRNHENITVDANIKVKADPSGIWNTATLSNGRNKTYLVYDQGTGLYYVADANGNYSTNTPGYKPEDFLKDDGGVYFR